MSPLTNSILNPSAEGATASLVSDVATSVSMVADAATGAGARSYSLAHGGGGAGLAGVRVRDAERPAAAAGQRWWARARCRLDTSVLGARQVSGKLVFRNASGSIIEHDQAPIGSPDGATHRWLGTPYASAAQRTEDGRTRTNVAPALPSYPLGNPTVTDRTVSFKGDLWRQFSTPAGGAVRFNLNGRGIPSKTLIGAAVTFGNPGSTTVGMSLDVGDENYVYVSLAPGEVRTVRTFGTPTADNVYQFADVESQPGNVPQTFLFKDVIIEVGVEAGDYFDGATPSTFTGYSDQAVALFLPGGVFHRWSAGVNSSPSERYEGTTRRINQENDPAPRNGRGVSGGNGTWTVASQDNAAYPSGREFRVTWSKGPTDGWNISGAFGGVTPGSPFTASLYAMASFPRARGRVVVEFQRADGSSLGYNYPPADMPLLSATQPTRLSWSGTVPAGASRGNVFLDNAATDGALPTDGSWVSLSSVLIETTLELREWFSGSSPSSGTGNTQDVMELIVAADAPADAASADLLIYRDPAYQAAATDKEFVDGLLLAQYARETPPPVAQSDGWYFTGAANASTSMYGRGSAVIEADSRTWSASLVFDSVMPTTQTMTVTAITPEATYPVRGGERAYAAGGLQLVDAEVPFGVPVSYRGQMFDRAGVDLGFTDASDVQIDIDPSTVVLSDPLAPATAVQVSALSSFGRSKARRRQGNTYRVGSRTFGLYAPLGLYEKLSLGVEVQDLGASDLLEEVLEAMPVLVRSMPPVRLPRQLYVAIEAPEVQDVDVQYGGGWSKYPLEAAQVSRTVTDVVIPIVTWQAYLDAFGTWSQFNAAYATWLDAQQNPPEVENARTGS